jgi:hypothetical protein
MKTCDQLQTMAVAYAEICRGEDPWIALGNFMNDWFDYAKDRREQLVTEPLSIPEPLTLDLHRWAAFCAASVEWLCQRYTVACPPWVHDPIYTLSTPWFYYPQARFLHTGAADRRKKLRERLRQHTPEPFTRRNVYCGNRMFANKYEFAEQFRASRIA